jgi:DNA-binding transcriptional ArsR family regulator
MRKVKTLDSLEQIKLLADDTKLALIELALHPTTVTAMAESLGVPRTRLYHHVKRLLDAGLLRVTSQSSKGPVIESEYQAAALTYRPSKQLVASLSATEVGAVLLSLVFGPAKAEFVNALDQGVFALSDSSRRRKVQVARHLLYLTTDELDRLIREIEDVYNRYDPDPEEIRPGSIPVAAVSVIHPRARAR